MIGNHDDVEVFIGVDVGKGEHHAVALDRAGKRLLDRALPNDEARIREIL
ncbi:IS110 family transposase, partial [Pseudarthrobacter polychromogenes]